MKSNIIFRNQIIIKHNQTSCKCHMVHHILWNAKELKMYCMIKCYYVHSEFTYRLKYFSLFLLTISNQVSEAVSSNATNWHQKNCINVSWQYTDATFFERTLQNRNGINNIVNNILIRQSSKYSVEIKPVV